MLVISSIYQAYPAVERKLVLGTIPLGIFGISIREIAVQGVMVIKFVNIKVRKIFASYIRDAVPVTSPPLWCHCACICSVEVFILWHQRHDSLCGRKHLGTSEVGEPDVILNRERRGG